MQQLGLSQLDHRTSEISGSEVEKMLSLILAEEEFEHLVDFLLSSFELRRVLHHFL